MSGRYQLTEGQQDRLNEVTVMEQYAMRWLNDRTALQDIDGADAAMLLAAKHQLMAGFMLLKRGVAGDYRP